MLAEDGVCNSRIAISGVLIDLSKRVLVGIPAKRLGRSKSVSDRSQVKLGVGGQGQCWRRGQVDACTQINVSVELALSVSCAGSEQARKVARLLPPGHRSGWEYNAMLAEVVADLSAY